MPDINIVNPKPFLSSLMSKKVSVRLKWGMEYRGILLSVDSYMNVQLADTEEYVDDQFAGVLGEVMIRCNNVMYIREAPEDGMGRRPEEEKEAGEEETTA